MKNQLLALIVVFSCFYSYADSNNEWISISNTPQCAADMSKPTHSIFVTASLRNTGIILNNLAKETKRDPKQFVGDGLRYFKIRLNRMSKEILTNLNNGTFGLVKSQEEAAAQWTNLPSDGANANYFNSLKCYQVNEINSYYSHLFIRGINADTLNELAKQLKNSAKLNNCDDANINNEVDLYPVYNYEFNPINDKQWAAKGFEFWQSYKIYLSWGWKNVTYNEAGSPYQKLVRLIPIEEQVLLISNGCKSIARPECNSDFLSSTELRQLFSTDRKKLELSSSSLEMKDNILENHDQLEAKIQQNIGTKSADNQWLKEFQKSYLGFSSKNVENLYTANKLYSVFARNKPASVAATDLAQEAADPTLANEMTYMCSEFRLLTQEEPLNIFKLDLKNLQIQASKLDQYLKYGLNVTEMFQLFQSSASYMKEACDKFDIANAKQPQTEWSNYRPWYKSFMSRYQVIQQNIQIEKEIQMQQDAAITATNIGPKTYINGMCSNAIDCHRHMMESIVNLNKLVLHSKIFLRTELTSAPLFNERSEKVACNLYDPWEPQKLNRKKLIADVASSVLFGWTSLPIYLDLNFRPKELVSMKKLVEDGHIKFEMGFDRGQIDKTLSLNLGSFLNVPCSISISQTGQNLNNNAGQFMYKGLSVDACKGTSSQTIDSPNRTVDEFKKSSNGSFQTCGQCSLNFEKVSALDAVNVYAPLRFILRIAQSLMRYHAVKNDDTINPREFNINQRYLIEAFDKNNGSIPENCVSLLARGLKCQKNICEALAVKEFEVKTGLEVENISIYEPNNGDYGSYNDQVATLQIKGISKTKDIRMQCREKGQGFYMYISKRNIEKYRNEAGLQ
ncbi:hypothetical protein K2P97_11790 [bacterium]|nr:hypothetical protein [bacterium]